MPLCHPRRPRRLRSFGGLAIVAIVASACGSAASSTPPATAVTATPMAPTSVPSAVGSTSPTALPPPSIAVKDGEPWIVYQRWTDEAGITLRLIRPDGTGDHALLAVQPAAQLHPDWSPDGARIAYTYENDLWVVNADGSDPARIFDCAAPCVFGNEAAWSPDGKTIAYITGTPDGDTARQTAFGVDVATGATRILYESNGPDFPAYVRWSPDRKSVVLDIVRYPNDKVDADPVVGEAIAILDLTATKSEARFLTDWSMFATYPDWSWTTDKIVFSTYDLGYRDFHALADYKPPSDLYTIDPDGTDLTQLTHNRRGTSLIRNGTASGGLSGQPTWAPDGSGIIFTQVEGETWPGWGLATISSNGANLAPAAGSTIVVGGHARIRPTR